MSVAGFSAALLRLLSARRAGRFVRALDDVAAAQERTLARIVQASANTGYGRAIGLNPGAGIAEFQSRVPVVDAATMRPWIERQRAQGGAVITPHGARCYEPTSGSTGATKWIPYNDAMLATFRSMFAIWAHDLLQDNLAGQDFPVRRLRPRSGRCFMSISSGAEAGGFKDDREYLGPLFRMLIGRFLVMPPRLGPKSDHAAFRDALIVALINCADLEVISIWNPSYLLILLEHFEKNRDRLLPMVAPHRRNIVADLPVCWQAVWPDLQLVSCWTEAAAAFPAQRLGALFPQAMHQGKGLLATEAPITVPLLAAGGCVPLVDEIFIELEDGEGRLRLLQDAEDAAEYTIVVTQPGGLLRYRLGDRVRVAGRFRNAPLLQFVGRADAVSDLVGEKLGEEFVAQILREILPDAFSVLLPIIPAGGLPYYCLLTDATTAAAQDAMENFLLQSMRYREARALGQLDSVRLMVDAGMRVAVHDALTANGFKAGNIKDRALLPSVELAEKVRAHVVSLRRSL